MYTRFAAFAAAAVMLAPFAAGALTVDELSAQMQTLLGQVTTLQRQIGTQSGSSATGNQSGCITITRNLGVGASGSDVTALQQFLLAQGVFSGTATGYFGALTEAGVQRFQAAQGIVSSGTSATTGFGYVGAKTRAALSRCGTAPVGGFLRATPVSGSIPLTVTIEVTVNTTRSCVQSSYALDYGDGSSRTMIQVPQGTCAPQMQTFTHTYQQNGTFALTLGAGSHQTSIAIVAGSGTGNSNPSQQSVTLSQIPLAFSVPGSFSLAPGQSAATGSFSIRLDQVRVTTSETGAVASAADVTIRDGNAAYTQTLVLNTPTVVGSLQITVIALTQSSARFSVAAR